VRAYGMKTNVRNSNGFSLIEMMTALVIIALTLLVLSAVLIHAIQTNVVNDLRNAAIRLTSQTAEVILALPFESIRSCGLTADPASSHYNDSYRYENGNTCLNDYPEDYLKYPNPVQTIKGFQQRFNITWDVLALTEDLRQITINVTYKASNDDHQHSAVIYKHRKP
jgi:prepilin-type N-terminal cleavage/methylation domain-containing protein